MARILVAEDDADIRHLMEIRLRASGHEVIAVSDGAAAVEVCLVSTVDLIVTDVSMPRMTGLELVQWVRAHARNPTVPVVMTTALSAPEDRRRGLEAGADAYLTKPFNFAELAATVEGLVRPTNRRP